MQGELDVEIQQSMAVKGSPCTRASASDGNGFIPKTFTMTVRTGAVMTRAHWRLMRMMLTEIMKVAQNSLITQCLQMGAD